MTMLSIAPSSSPCRQHQCRCRRLTDCKLIFMPVSKFCQLASSKSKTLFDMSDTSIEWCGMKKVYGAGMDFRE